MCSMVRADGRFWRADPAVADDRAMPQRRLRLAGGDVQALRDARKHPTRRGASTARDAELKTGDRLPVPLLRDDALSAAGPYDQTHARAEHRTLRLDPSGE